MDVTAILAFKIFVSATAFAGLLDMYTVQLLKSFSADFKADRFIDQNLRWATALPGVRRVMGDSTLTYMKSRTLLFPAFEIAFGSLVVIALYRYGLGSEFIRIGIFLVIAMLLAMISWNVSEDFTAPNLITYPGTVIGLLISLIIGPANTTWPSALTEAITSLLPHSPTLANTFLHILNSLLGGLIGGGSLWLMGWIWERLRGVEAMGLGAVKTGMMIGVFCGWQLAILTILLASLIGSLFGFILALRLRQRAMSLQLPFPPFLLLAGTIAMLWGASIVSWYLAQFRKN